MHSSFPENAFLIFPKKKKKTKRKQTCSKKCNHWYFSNGFFFLLRKGMHLFQHEQELVDIPD